MRKFDPIDIFFIAIITTYFITLICIGITFLCIKLSKKNVKNDSEKQLNDINVAKEEKKSIKIPKDSKISIRSLKEKVFSSTFFRKLFMKEVKSKEQILSSVVLEDESIVKVESKKDVKEEQKDETKENSI